MENLGIVFALIGAAAAAIFAGMGSAKGVGLVGQAGAGVVTEEYTTCIHYLFCQLLVIGCGDNQMLRRISIAEVDSLLFGLHEDKLRVV